MEISIFELKQLAAATDKPNQGDAVRSPFVVGESYFIRTVTHIVTGKLVSVFPNELELVNAAWIADTGRYSNAVVSGEFDEVEPYPDGVAVIVGRGAIVDCCRVSWPLPRVQK